MVIAYQAKLLDISDPVLAARLYAMGIIPGKQITICRKAILGGAYYLESGSFTFILRQEEFYSLSLEAELA